MGRPGRDPVEIKRQGIAETSRNQTVHHEGCGCCDLLCTCCSCNWKPSGGQIQWCRWEIRFRAARPKTPVLYQSLQDGEKIYISQCGCHQTPWESHHHLQEKHQAGREQAEAMPAQLLLVRTVRKSLKCLKLCKNERREPKFPFSICICLVR